MMTPTHTTQQKYVCLHWGCTEKVLSSAKPHQQHTIWSIHAPLTSSVLNLKPLYLSHTRIHTHTGQSHLSLMLFIRRASKRKHWLLCWCSVCVCDCLLGGQAVSQCQCVQQYSKLAVSVSHQQSISVSRPVWLIATLQELGEHAVTARACAHAFNTVNMKQHTNVNEPCDTEKNIKKLAHKRWTAKK